MTYIEAELLALHRIDEAKAHGARAALIESLQRPGRGRTRLAVGRLTRAWRTARPYQTEATCCPGGACCRSGVEAA
jgi:hypothetical protein